MKLILKVSDIVYLFTMVILIPIISLVYLIQGELLLPFIGLVVILLASRQYLWTFILSCTRGFKTNRDSSG